MKSLIALVCALACFAPARAVEVTAQDSIDAYEISGAVLLDASFPEARDAAKCAHCHWRILPLCRSGSLDDHRSCLNLPIKCPTGPAEVWRANAVKAPPVGDPRWVYRGLMCLTTAPTAIHPLQQEVRSAVLRYLPSLTPGAQPNTSTFVGLEVYFRSNQPTVFAPTSLVVAEQSVSLRAHPTWTWEFGDGTTLSTSNPGDVRPNGQVRHTYTRAGTYVVRVSCLWRGEFDAQGATGIPVPGLISQTASLNFHVRDARTLLIPSPQH